jgi:hypothetical protein
VCTSIIGTSTGKPAIQVSRAVASPKPPCVTMPISAEVPPTSKVMRLRCPERAPAQSPPITPAAGPDRSVSTGRSATMAGVATPPFDAMMRKSALKPLASISLSRRVT